MTTSKSGCGSPGLNNTDDILSLSSYESEFKLSKYDEQAIKWDTFEDDKELVGFKSPTNPTVIEKKVQNKFKESNIHAIVDISPEVKPRKRGSFSLMIESKNFQLFSICISIQLLIILCLLWKVYSIGRQEIRKNLEEKDMVKLLFTPSNFESTNFNHNPLSFEIVKSVTPSNLILKGKYTINFDTKKMLPVGNNKSFFEKTWCVIKKNDKKLNQWVVEKYTHIKNPFLQDCGPTTRCMTHLLKYHFPNGEP